jgi:hypothetical protein
LAATQATGFLQNLALPPTSLEAYDTFSAIAASIMVDL